MKDAYNESEISRLLKTDFPLYFETETVSTNDLAKAGAKDGERLAAFVAAAQTGGRGRMGRPFLSPDGGIYLSLLMPLCDIEGDAFLRLTTAACVAVRRAIASVCGIDTGIKWVNDLYYKGKKVCGILCESIDANGERLCVIGVGINLCSPQGGFIESIRDIAGALFTCDAPPRAALAAAVIDALTHIEDDCRSGGYIEEYRRHSLVLGKKIVFFENGESVEAVAEDISKSGGLVVRLQSGSTRTLNSGEISVKMI